MYSRTSGNGEADGSRQIQLRHIHDYIAHDSTLYANTVSEALVRWTLELDKLPRKGRNVTERNEDAVRELPHYSYRNHNEIKSENLVAVLAIIHERQHLETATSRR